MQLSEFTYDSIIQQLRIYFFFNFKTGNYLLDTFIVTAFFSFITFFINYYYDHIKFIGLSYFSNKYITFFYKNHVVLEGKVTLKTSGYTVTNHQLFSSRFKALWKFINNKLNKDCIKVQKIKEYAQFSNQYDDIFEYNLNKKKDDFIKNDIFVVDQFKPFELIPNIWCCVKNDRDIEESQQGKNISRINIITVHLFSNKFKLIDIQKFIDKITKEYLESIYNFRENKTFIYTLNNIPQKNRDDSDNDGILKNTWDECEFSSTRNFDNLFFDDKEELIKKIDFFENNKEWYEKEGHPYTLGIGLYGPPGTGKTSVIKCIANKLKRHLIVIPLNKITTQSDFTKFYFEQQYNQNNKSNSIKFKDKIIVLDDLDCMSDIIEDRDNKTPENSPQNNENKEFMSAMLSNFKNKSSNDSTGLDFKYFVDKNQDKLTLSFLLNIIDGIRETPGRILIITSNFYQKIDKAFKRPGRIDYALEMKNASIKTICDMYYHYYNEKFPNLVKDKLVDYKLSPAKIVNIRLASDNSKEFLNNLLREMK